MGRWICMVLEWTSEEAIAYSRIDLSLLQHQSTSQEKHGHGRLRNHQTFSSISLLGTLGPGAGDRRLCMRLVLVSFALIYSCIIIPLYETLHDQPFSVTSEESLRDSEPPDTFLLGTVLVSFTLIYTHCQLHVH